MKDKIKYIIPGFIIMLIFLNIDIGDKKSVSECRDIIQKIHKESFKGTIYRKHDGHHYTELFVNSNIGIVSIIPPCPCLYDESNIGDSIIKLEHTNIVKIKALHDTIWIKYKYKSLPYSCDAYSCRFKDSNGKYHCSSNGTD